MHLLGTDKPREARDLNRTLEVKPSPSVSTSHRCTGSPSLSLCLFLSCFFTVGLAQIQVCRSTPAKLSASSDIHKLPNSHSQSTHFHSVLIIFLDDVHTLFCERVAKHLSSHLPIFKQMSRCVHSLSQNSVNRCHSYFHIVAGDFRYKFCWCPPPKSDSI